MTRGQQPVLAYFGRFRGGKLLIKGEMATTARSRPGGGFDIHDDHTLALGELPLSNIQNIQTISSSIESLARQLDNFHIYNNDKENKLSCAVEVSSTQVEASSLDIDGNSPEEFHAPAGAHTKHVSFDFEGILCDNAQAKHDVC